MVNNNPSNFNLKQLREILGEKDFQRFTEQLNAERAVPPKIAIIGKSGVGKTSTINALFNLEEEVSHVGAGTLVAAEKSVVLPNGIPLKEVDMPNPEKKDDVSKSEEDFKKLPNGTPLKAVDMPGLGEDLEKDKEYKLIYEKILPTSDIILYIIQADLKALRQDQRILKEIVCPIVKDIKERLVIGLNQVDRIGPGNWNLKFNWPSPEQEASIDRRCLDIRAKFSKEVDISADQIEYYSAEKRYRLFNLLSCIIRASGKVGWKFPVNPASPIDLADPSVQDLLRRQLDF
jgi:uncharacterized protein